MAFPRLEKLVVKISTFTLGGPVTYSLLPEAIDLVFRGIFDNAFMEVNGVSSTYPIINVDLAKLPRYPSIKDRVTKDLVQYKIIDVRQDGIGGAILVLHKMS